MPASIPAPTGTPAEKAVLTASNGTWGGTAPFGYAYQWKRCTQSSSADASGSTCTSISGATGKTYQAVTADIGKHLRVGIRANNLVLAALSGERLSASVGPIAAPPGFDPTPPNGFPKPLNKASAAWVGLCRSTPAATGRATASRWRRASPTGGTAALTNGTGCVLLPNTTSSYETTTDDVDHVVKATVIGTITDANNSNVTTSSPEKLADISGAVYEQTPSAVDAAEGRRSRLRRHRPPVDRWCVDGQRPDLHPPLAALQRRGPPVRRHEPGGDDPDLSGDKRPTSATPSEIEVSATVVDSFQSRVGTTSRPGRRRTGARPARPAVGVELSRVAVR